MGPDGDSGRERGAAAGLEQALGRVRRHGRTAARESLAALGALAEAIALAATGEVSSARRLAAPLARLLDDLGGLLARPGAGRRRLLDALAHALDTEIGRWEVRARRDPDARAVLRTFLSVREVLWELGVRRTGEAEAAGGERPPRQRARPQSGPRHPRGRVQRLRVED